MKNIRSTRVNSQRTKALTNCSLREPYYKNLPPPRYTQGSIVRSQMMTKSNRLFANVLSCTVTCEDIQRVNKTMSFEWTYCPKDALHFDDKKRKGHVFLSIFPHVNLISSTQVPEASYNVASDIQELNQSASRFLSLSYNSNVTVVVQPSTTSWMNSPLSLGENTINFNAVVVHNSCQDPIFLKNNPHTDLIVLSEGSVLSTCTIKVVIHDTTPPTFTFCPGNREFYLTRGQSKVAFVYDRPLASDNSNKQPRIYQTRGKRVGEYLGPGRHSFEFVAEDEEHNRATCQFLVRVVRYIDYSETSVSRRSNPLIERGNKIGMTNEQVEQYGTGLISRPGQTMKEKRRSKTRDSAKLNEKTSKKELSAAKLAEIIPNISNAHRRRHFAAKLRNVVKREQSIKRRERKRAEKRGEEVIRQIPNTIESLRVLDETVVQPGDQEVTQAESLNEFASYMKGTVTPKIMITTSRKPSTVLKNFIKELLLIIPSSFYYARGNYRVHSIVKYAVNKSFTDVVVVGEHLKKPSSLYICHLPEGPTSFFRLSNVKLAQDMHGSAALTTHLPEVLLNNFTTRLGRRVAQQLMALFPQKPEFQGRRAICFHNQRDFIFFRHHRLQEIGPRFTMKLRWLQSGIFEGRKGMYEFEWRPDSNVNRKVMML